MEKENKDLTNFKISRVEKIKEMYSDEQSTKRRYDRNTTYGAKNFSTAAEVRNALMNSFENAETVVEMSKKLYCINPIYSSIINYLADMFMWRYKVIPHKVYTKSKAKAKKQLKEDDFTLIYNLMLEATDGLSIETKFPAMLTLLFITGSVYFTTVCDEDTLTIDTLLLPTKYCRKIGENQYGTPIIEFDFSYFRDCGVSQSDLDNYFKSFPKNFKKSYLKYLKDNNCRWQVLDPHFSSGLMLNEMGTPTYLYLYGGILDYEKYQDNELERNENLLKYIVVQTMPHYEDKLIFEMDEVKELHNSMKKIIDKGDKARLVTTYGDIHVDKISENDTAENQVLSKAFKAIFNNAGFNSAIFTSESVEALRMSLIRDKGLVWKYVQNLLSFYNIAINNWFDFKIYQADIDILPISPYTYNDDIKVYKENATLGVDKLGYIIATGIKQKNIVDQMYLENFLHLDEIQPMQTSYTQTAEDRMDDATGKNKDEDNSEEVVSKIEPLENNKEVKEKSTSKNSEE